MKNILSYNEFIYEDYRDVTGGSGGIHADDKLSNNMGIAGVGSNTTLDTIADPSGEKKVLGTEEIKIKDPYFAIRKKKEKKKTDVEEEKKKRMRRKAYKYLHDIDKKNYEKMKHIKVFKLNENIFDNIFGKKDNDVEIVLDKLVDKVKEVTNQTSDNNEILISKLEELLNTLNKLQPSPHE